MPSRNGGHPVGAVRVGPSPDPPHPLVVTYVGRRRSPMFEAVEELLSEHAVLEERLADPAVHADQAEARRLSKRYAELTPITATYRQWRQTGEDIETAR